MAVRRQTQVMAAMDGLAGRAVGRVAKDYRRKVVGPIVRRIGEAKSLKGLLAEFGPGLVREMDSTALEEGLTNATVQAGGIGFVSAMPRETSKRQNVETSKRQNVKTNDPPAAERMRNVEWRKPDTT